MCLPGLPSEPQGFLRLPAQQTCGSQQPCLSPSTFMLSRCTQGSGEKEGDIETGSERETEGRSLGSREEERKGEKEGEMEEGEGREEEERKGDPQTQSETENTKVTEIFWKFRK